MAQASAKRLVSLEDYYRFETVGSPAISPDGQQVAFVWTRVLEEENCSHSEIWLVPTDGSREPVRVTSPVFDASAPRWSPDGRLLSFSSSRKLPGTKDQKPNPIWFLWMDRPVGEAFQIEGVGGSPIFSPDNRWIAYAKPTPPSNKRETKYESDFERRVHERFDGRVYDWLNYRFDRRGYLPDPRDPNATPPEELYVVSREGGSPRQLTRLGFHVQEPEWGPDGKALAFTADSHQRDEYTYERSDLWTVEINGELRRLTDDEYNYSSPAWSPDGRRIVMRGNLGLDAVVRSRQNYGSPTDLFVVPAEGGSPENITKDWDLIPGAPQWSPDGNHICFTAGTGGNTHLFRVPARGGAVEQVTHGDRWLSGFSFSSDFTRMTYHASDPMDLGDVFSSKIDGSSERQLTHANKHLLDELELSSAERILYKSRDGTEIEGWIMQPSGRDPKKGPYPMILTIHGGPHSAYGNDFSFNRQLYAANGYFVLYTNPRGSTGYGEKFHWATWGGWGVLDFEDLMAGVDYALKHYPIDSKRQGVTGRSYGGFMTNWINGHTDRFAAAVAGASISNWVSDYGVADIARTKESEFYGTPWEEKSRDLMIKLSPITYAGNARTPTLFIQGEQDYRAPIEEAEQMYFALKKLRVPAKFIRLPDSSHGNWTPWRSVYSLYQEMKWWEEYLQYRPSSEQ